MGEKSGAGNGTGAEEGKDADAPGGAFGLFNGDDEHGEVEAPHGEGGTQVGLDEGLEFWFDLLFHLTFLGSALRRRAFRVNWGLATSRTSFDLNATSSWAIQNSCMCLISFCNSGRLRTLTWGGFSHGRAPW